MSRNSKFLDADGSFEQNLRIVRNEDEDYLSSYFGKSGFDSSNNGAEAPPRDFKVVKPSPGFCIKTFKANSNEKYFINVCQAEELPQPKDITEEELAQILNSDETSSFRIPMSISEPRMTKDKSNNPVEVCDIAVHPKFFLKLQNKILFRDFFMALIAEAINDKYNVQLKVEKSIILNNRKFIGMLVSHRVRNNDVKKIQGASDDTLKLRTTAAAAGGGGGGGKLVQEINPKEAQKLIKQQPNVGAGEHSSQIKKAISQASSTEPEYKLRAKLRIDEQVEELQAEFYLPKCVTAQELYLDIGEDRILLESMKHGYLFEKFVNYRLNQERAKAIFDKTNKMLQVRVPVYPVQ